MLDPNLLASLVALDRAGTVTAAAAELGYSPSGVSQQLASLERAVGVALLRPDGRRVALTDAGRALVAASDGVFAALERATTAARVAASASAGTVRLGALGTTIIDLVPSAVASLAAEDSGTALMVVDLGDEILPALRQRRVDVAVDHQWSNVPDVAEDGLRSTELCVEPVFVIANDQLDLADGGVRRDLPWVEHPCAQCGPAGRDIIARLGDPDPTMPFETDDITVLLHVAALGAAATVLPALACLHLPDGVRAWRVPGITRSIAASTRAAAADDPRLATVTRHLRAAGRAVERRFDAIECTTLTTMRPPSPGSRW